jgi:uroporphyrinogen decarboxylase
MPAMDRREMILGLAAGRSTGGYVPAAFFLHFDEAHRAGTAAVEKHLEFFRATGMDMLKVQYEHPYPRFPKVKAARDWRTISVPGLDHFEEPLAVVEGMVKAVGREAPVIVTLYSALMHAQHAKGRETVTAHLEEDPESAGQGLLRIAESVLLFARECLKRGVDGFYMSTQGGEAGRFSSAEIFRRAIAPADLLVMKEVAAACPFNILHVCDIHGAYDDITPYRDFPGQVVNCGTRLRSRMITPGEIATIFRRPFMGGMERLGVLVSGTEEQIREEARAVCDAAPDLFILGADCTVPSETPWRSLKAAIDAAHGAR